MQILRQQHQKPREQLKTLFMDVLRSYGIDSIIRWNGFEFEGKTTGTRIRGKISHDEILVEISGWFERIAAQKLREGWNDLVMKGLV